LNDDQAEHFRPFEQGGLRLPPRFCQYAGAACDQDFQGTRPCTAFFLFPSQPAQIAATVEAAVKRLKYAKRQQKWRSWKDLQIGGQIVFCEVCKASRFAESVVADVTTLNFNLLFEIGFAIGLGLPVIPIRDTSFLESKREFDELGVLDTVGYQDFANSEQLAESLTRLLPGKPVAPPPQRVFTETPLYVLKGPINTDGAVKLMSTLKKSGLRFRTHDPVETPRLSLFEARRQVSGSIGVVGHLLSPKRRGSTAHNALCALLCGMGMAEQKVVIMLQEENIPQPLDYRDVVQAYSVPEQIPQILERPIRLVVQQLQRRSGAQVKPPEKILEKVDLGDPAAENEIAGLREYFVQTGQFTAARQGHSRLVIGRKGTGKTAMFYAVRNAVGRGHSSLVLDLKPEGHQFTKLREAVLSSLAPGMREHTMTAFWTYILLAELAHKVVWDEATYAQRDPDRMLRFEALRVAYSQLGLEAEDDLSQRLLREVDRVAAAFDTNRPIGPADRITEIVYQGDLRELEAAVSTYLQEKEVVWLLIDNLDKGWPTHGTSDVDILIVRSLLEAARKLQQSLQPKEVELRCLVFLRTDIFEHLVRETPDKGKDTPVRLDWDDREVFEEIIRQRIQASTNLVGEFRQLWPRLFESHIGAEDSFSYMLDRTLLRPRDLLQFLQRAIEVAVNRGHTRATEDDILQAEHSYSEDLLLTTAFEIADTNATYRDLLYAFQGCPCVLTYVDVVERIRGAGVGEGDLDHAIEMLVWFGFLGATAGDPADAKYSYEVRYNLRRLLHPTHIGSAVFAVHPGFRAALEVVVR
jgi:hypothetical protein